MKVKSVFEYFVKVKLEFSKVVWLKSNELSQLLITVLVTTVLTACFFAVLDAISQTLIMRVVFM